MGKNPQGQLLGQSSSLNNSLVEFQAVENTQQIPTKPQVVRFNGRDIVLCGTPLIVNGDMVGKLYLSQDITLDQQKLNFSLWRLFFISIVTVTVLVIAISYTISTGLKPLKKNESGCLYYQSR